MRTLRILWAILRVGWKHRRVLAAVVPHVKEVELAVEVLQERALVREWVRGRWPKLTVQEADAVADAVLEAQ